MKINLSICLLLFFASCASKEVQHSSQNIQNPEVIAVYPTMDTLPENLLRFYVQFSHSMKAVNNLENIKLLNAIGEEIVGAIFNNVYELWDREQKQLTLILDPSRVKTGLQAHKSLGRALVPGERFQLLIEAGEDIDGKPLSQPFVKYFWVKKADTQMPDIERWNILPPASNTQSALQITFPQALDRMSLLTRIQLLHFKDQLIDGTIEISNEEKIWRFIPKQNWKKGQYTLLVNTRLEDPAGNNLNGLFDHEIGSLKREQEEAILKIEIEIK